jgi:hypothetical protein
MSAAAKSSSNVRDLRGSPRNGRVLPSGSIRQVVEVLHWRDIGDLPGRSELINVHFGQSNMADLPSS